MSSMARRLWRALLEGRPWALGVALAPLALLAAVFLTLHLLVSSPAKLPPEERTVLIPRGSSLPAIAKRLHGAGLVKSPWRFLLAARLSGASTKLQAGEYILSTGLSPRQLTQALVEGRTVEVGVTVPEGLTVREVGGILERAGLAEAEEIERLATDGPFLASVGIEASSIEGYLHPETYRFRKGVGARSALAAMVKSTLALFDREALSHAAELGLSLHEVLVLASIVEKETAVEDERPRIAAVFLNRLHRSIPLQADPTIIYALGEAFDGNLTRAHLNLDSPYNTYLHPGLPPTPIANPGRASIEAVLKPADVEDLYFVAKPDGSHHFSSSLRDHQRAVRRYQVGRR